jgi:hypothetical protein
MVRYGNYCGANWSAGQNQASVVSTVLPIDEFDATCQTHDRAYALGGNLGDADVEFAVSNFGRGFVRSAAATIVGGQGLLRKAARLATGSSELAMTRSLRGAQTAQPKRHGMLPALPEKPVAAQVVVVQKRRKNKVSSLRDAVAQARLVQAPAAVGREVAMSRPRITSNPSGTTTITHREFITVVSGATAYTATAVGINPGLGTFAWLQQVAANYDRYTWGGRGNKVGLKFTYVPSAATSTKGRVTMAFDYNAQDVLPAVKSAFYAITPNVESPVWSDLVLPVPSDGHEYFVRIGGNPIAGNNSVSSIANSTDRKTFDMGTLFYAVDLGPDTGTIGEIYCDYTLTLKNPRPPAVLGGELYCSAPTTTSLLVNSTTTNIGNASIICDDASWTNTFDIGASGTYQITLTVNGTLAGPTATFGVSPNYIGTTAALTISSQTAVASTTSLIRTAIVKVTVDPVLGFCPIQITQGGTYTAVTTALLYVARMPDASYQ